MQQTPAPIQANSQSSQGAASQPQVQQPVLHKQTTATVAHPVPPPTSTAGAIGGTLFSLSVVLALIFILAWVVRRMPNALGQRSHGLRLIASLPLSTRERIVVVDVGGTQLLLGTGASGTRMLHKLDTPLPEVPAAQAPAFAQLLAKHMRKPQ